MSFRLPSFIPSLLTCAVLSVAAPASPSALQTGSIVSAPRGLAATAKGDITLVDVRSGQEWRQTGVATGAKRVTIHNPNGIKAFVAEMVKAVGGDKSRPVALICAAGVRSARAEKILVAAGFSNLQNVSEGMMGRPDAGPGWLKRGLPVTPCPEC